MSPSSRGVSATSKSTSSTVEPSTEAIANNRSSHALTSLKLNINYLLAPNSPLTPRPGHLRTRALLRSIRFLAIFIFWRVVRYAKYAVVGSLVAALGATAFGSVITGAAAVVAPTGILATLGMGMVWGVGRWGVRRWVLKGKGKGTGEVIGAESEHGGRASGNVRLDGQWRDVQGPRATPW